MSSPNQTIKSLCNEGCNSNFSSNKCKLLTYSSCFITYSVLTTKINQSFLEKNNAFFQSSIYVTELTSSLSLMLLNLLLNNLPISLWLLIKRLLIKSKKFYFPLCIDYKSHKYMLEILFY